MEGGHDDKDEGKEEDEDEVSASNGGNKSYKCGEIHLSDASGNVSNLGNKSPSHTTMRSPKEKRSLMSTLNQRKQKLEGSQLINTSSSIWA